MEDKMPKGGARPGAGRKANSGAFMEPTVVKRIPVSLVSDIDRLLCSLKEEQNKPRFKIGFNLKQLASVVPSNLNLPLFSSRVAAGFPSPADDHLEATLDLNQYLIRRPSATFFVRASGDSMINAGINNDDILVVDRSLEARHGDIIIAALNGELTVKRLHCRDTKVALKPENPNYPMLDITEEMNFHIWGVVTSVIHQCKLT